MSSPPDVLLKHLSGLPKGAMALAHSISAVAPHTCDGAKWTFGEVRGRLTRVQVCCGEPLERTFLRGVDRAGWYVDDEVAIGDALRSRALNLCQPTTTGEQEDERTCGTVRHMYEDGGHAVTGVSEVERASGCVTSRHVDTYGALGLPGQPFEPARTLGHQEPIGKQGQPRHAVAESAGCSDETMWAHLHRRMPLVLRGCVNTSSPGAMGWTARHLKRVAGNQSAPECDQQLGSFISSMNRTGWVQYRSCGRLPPDLLKDIAVPYALRIPTYRRGFDKAVMWLGRSNISPLHFDPNHNYMHQLAGQKRILLIDPADSALLYADHAKNALGNTPVDLFKIDLNVYPLVAHATLWPVVLEPGDVLFIPSQWWHLVVSLPDVARQDAADERNLAITVQFDSMAGGGSWFSRQIAEDYLNIPTEVPTVEEENAKSDEWRWWASQPEPKSLADLRRNE